jgi:hypothetical protein
MLKGRARVSDVQVESSETFVESLVQRSNFATASKDIGVVAVLGGSGRRLPTKGGCAMAIEGRIDDLIEAGWRVIHSDFDPVAFHHWRLMVFDCLTAMLGRDHVYTLQFGDLVGRGGRTGILAGEGILCAVQQGIACNGLDLVGANGGLQSISCLAEKTGEVRENLRR